VERAIAELQIFTEMKINIAYPAAGTQKLIEVDDDRKLRAFYDKRMSEEVAGDSLGDEFKGYVFKITGGNDKEGFAMHQGILTTQRVRILMREGMHGYRPRRVGERKRKSVRGCIVSQALSVLDLIIVKKGEQDIAGLTDTSKDRRLGPKRASKIRKMFNLSKKDDVRTYVVRRAIVKEGKKPISKAPKIQRLVTPIRLQRRRKIYSLKKQHWEKQQAEAKEFNALLSKRLQEARDKRAAEISRRRSTRRSTGTGATPSGETPKGPSASSVTPDGPAAPASAQQP